MDDCISSDEEHYYSDRDSMGGLENDESDPLWVPAKGPTTKVFDSLIKKNITNLAVFELFRSCCKVNFFFFVFVQFGFLVANFGVWDCVEAAEVTKFVKLS